MTSGKIDISRLRNEVINSTYKGLPIQSHGKTINTFLASKPNLFESEFQFPMAAIKASSLKHNIERMVEYCKSHGIVHSPHVKTTMSPEIAKMQMDAGSWSITVANYFQANIFLDFGFRRILIANEVIDPTATRAIAQRNTDPDTQIIFYVDSLEGLATIQSSLAGQAAAKLYLLIEVGKVGERAGMRDLSGVEPLAQKISEDARLTLLGISGYEGILNLTDRSESGSVDVREFLRKMVAAARIARPFVSREKIILTAGGSAFFDIVVEEFAKYEGESLVVIRNGAYVSHDHQGYDLVYPFVNETPERQLHPAIEIWSQTISKPESLLAILNVGKRDLGNDSGNPTPIKKRKVGAGAEIEPFAANIHRLNDQHGYMSLNATGDLAITDYVALGISHPCTTFDKWRYMALVNDDYEVIDLLHTFF